MNKVKLAAIISDKCSGINKKQAEDMLDCFTDTVMRQIKEEKTVTLTGFGAFSARVRKGRVGVNPQDTSRNITIPDTLVVKFKAGKRLKDYLKGSSMQVPAMEDVETPPEGAPETEGPSDAGVEEEL